MASGVVVMLVLGSLALVAAPVVVFAAAVSSAPDVAAALTDLGAAVPSSGVADIPAAALGDYMTASGYCPGLPWVLLAGIGKVESDHGRADLPGVRSGANPAGAEGPMQFLPATFAVYAVPEGSGGTGPSPPWPPSPYNLADAAVAAARMLCADGAGDPATVDQAIWDYNHSATYVAEVLGWAGQYQAAYQAVVGAGAGAAAAAWALAQVGKPYRWGADGPSEYDCSGLTMRAWQAVGLSLPRIAADQYGAGVLVPLGDAQIGDLVFFAVNPSDPSTIDHVGIYLGGGLMVDAPHTGTVVRVEPIWPAGLVSEVTRP
jgi:cell wall-associated NlpC family hydrolase